jgi:hypothetical protein
MGKTWRYLYPITSIVQQALLRNSSIWSVAAVLALGTMAGCATPRFESFPDALQSCRQMQPGRTLWKNHRPATFPLVAACLERHGWNPDGSPAAK